MLAYRIDDRTRHAAVWLPPSFSADQTWPLVVFLHAYEERGEHNEHLSVGIGPTLTQQPELYEAIVLLPQCPRDSVWSTVDRPWAEGMRAAEDHVDAALEAALETYPIDRERITLTGASMGGFGTVSYGARRANRFCAFAPICGAAAEEDVSALATKPIWIVHGDADDVVPVEESRRLVTALRERGADDSLRYTEFAGGGHDVWDRAYADPSFAAFVCGQMPSGPNADRAS